MENSRRNRNVVMGALTVGALSLITLQNLEEGGDELVENVRTEKPAPKKATKKSEKPVKSTEDFVDGGELTDQQIVAHGQGAMRVLDGIDMDDDVTCRIQSPHGSLGILDESTKKFFEHYKKFNRDATGKFADGMEIIRYNDPEAGIQHQMFIYLDGQDCDGKSGVKRNAYEFPVLVTRIDVDLETGKEVAGWATKLCLEVQPEDSDLNPYQGAIRAYDEQLEAWGIGYRKYNKHPKVQDACTPGWEEGTTSVFLNGENVGIVEAHEQGKDADGMTSITMPNGTKVRYNPNVVVGVSLETPGPASEQKE